MNPVSHGWGLHFRPVAQSRLRVLLWMESGQEYWPYVIAQALNADRTAIRRAMINLSDDGLLDQVKGLTNTRYRLTCAGVKEQQRCRAAIQEYEK